MKCLEVRLISPHSAFVWFILNVYVIAGTNFGWRPTEPGYNVEFAMKQAEIVPNILPNAPKNYVWVEYYGRFPVLLGNDLSPYQVKEKPFIHYVAEKDALYTITMIDPDAPSRKSPNISEVLHFLVGNIPGNNIHGGEMIAEYLGAAPPMGTGPHRYIFFLFKQPEMITFEEDKITKETDEKQRYNFKLKDFVEKYKLGDPVAGNFYYSRHVSPFPHRPYQPSGFKPGYQTYW